ncbi:hypothetical protein A5643_10195 [Mycobacterium sp. 1274756.6]|nr:hypothetical protein A5643_10195 [Mycobacterium sp. 1274756.6]
MWWAQMRSVIRTEIADVRRGHWDLDPADLTRFTLPLLIRLLGVLAIGAVPLLVIRSSDATDDVLVPVLGSIALTLICTAVVAWLITIVFSGLVLVVVYRTPPHAASRLVIRTVIDAFRRISDLTALLVTLTLVAGVVALAIGLPSRRDSDAGYSLIDDLLAAQVGVLLAALALSYLAEAARCAAELVDYKSLLLAWPWSLGITCAAWVVATTTGPFQSTRLLGRLLADWLPGTVDGVPQRQVIDELLPAGAHWWAAFAAWPLIALIWAVEAHRHNGFQQMREFLRGETDPDETNLDETDLDEADRAEADPAENGRGETDRDAPPRAETDSAT